MGDEESGNSVDKTAVYYESAADGIIDAFVALSESSLSKQK
jgi:hypothetical protein